MEATTALRKIRSSGGATGEQTNWYLGSLDPLLAGPIVSWAAATLAPMWLHIAREYTERWHHRQQIRMAAGRPLPTDPYWLSPVIATFVHGLPRSYSDVDAPVGSTVRITIYGPPGGTWLIVRTGPAWVSRQGRLLGSRRPRNDRRDRRMEAVYQERRQPRHRITG